MTGIAYVAGGFGSFLSSVQYVTLRQRKNDWDSVTTSHPDYIRFYNSLWLVANDVIIGIALGSYIIDNAGWLASQISSLLSLYTVEALHRSISWLMGWPAGLKLNTELAAFLGDLFLWVIDYWSSKAPGADAADTANVAQVASRRFARRCRTSSGSSASRASPEPACPLPCFRICCPS